MNKKKLNKRVHKWLSLPLGIILSIVCLTGAILVFQQEVLELSNPSHYFIEKVESKPLSLDELVPLVNQQLENNSVANVKVSVDPNRTYTMGLSEGFRVSVFVNQYTGEITGRYAVKESGFFQIMALHRWLLDSTHTWGKYTVGIATLLFIIILITGWFYNTKRTKEKHAIHRKQGTRRLMFDLHNVLGGYSALVLLICALTGLMWSFEWYRDAVFAMFGAEELPKEGNARQGKKEKSEINTIHWQTALDNTKKVNPEYDYIRIENGLTVLHPNNTYRTRVTDRYTFDKETGEIIKTVLFGEQDVRTKVWAWAYSLHVGDYWGIWSKIFTFIFCIIGASLPITGYYLWYKKWKVKREKKKRKKDKRLVSS